MSTSTVGKHRKQTPPGGVGNEAPDGDGPPSTSASKPASKLKALWLIAPALTVLAVVIGYPIIRAIFLSFQADRHIDPDTGMFVEGGFAGFQHYLYWLTQRCMLADGTVGTCAPGTLSLIHI